MVVADDADLSLARVDAFFADEANHLGVEVRVTLSHRHATDVVQQTGGEPAAAVGGALRLIGDYGAGHCVCPELVDIELAALQLGKRRDQHHAGDDPPRGVESDADDRAVGGIDPVDGSGRGGVGGAQHRGCHRRVGLHGFRDLGDLRFVLLEQRQCARLRQWKDRQINRLRHIEPFRESPQWIIAIARGFRRAF